MATDLKCPICRNGLDSGLCKHHLDKVVEGLNALPARLAEVEAERDDALDGCARILRQKEGLAVQFTDAERREKELRTLLSVVAEGYCIHACRVNGPGEVHDGICQDIQATQK